jgi:predicted PurR-regulated permease PerM
MKGDGFYTFVMRLFIQGRDFMWFKNKIYKYLMAVLMITLIIYLVGKIDFFIAPFQKLLAILFFPVIIGLLFYYLLRPLVRWVQKFRIYKKQISKGQAIVVVFLVSILLFLVLGIYIGTIVANQFQQLITDLPQISQMVKGKILVWVDSPYMAYIFTQPIKDTLTSYLQGLLPSLRDGLLETLSRLSGIASVLIVVPFIVFYLLKDDSEFYNKIQEILPHRYKKEIISLIGETDQLLSSYILGQGIVALILGTFTYIGYLLIGLKYSFILAMFVLITAFIPLFGALIGVVPAVLVGLTIHPTMMLKVIVISIIVQLLEGNFISPYLIGKRMAIHPLTTILLFLVAASMYGFVGMLIVIPTYAVLKVILVGGRRIYKQSS